jgi:predicted transcriptional regulator
MIEELTQDFDDNEDFVLSIIAFLKEIGWLKEEQSGKYIITDEGAAEL